MCDAEPARPVGRNKAVGQWSYNNRRSGNYQFTLYGRLVTTTELLFICKKCGFRYGNIIAIKGDLSGITLANNNAICPRCGTYNRQALPDGQYNVRGGRWEVARQVARDILSEQPTAEEIGHLAQVVKEAEASGADFEQVASAIEKQTRFTKLADAIRKADREHPPGWVAYILSIILSTTLPYIISPVIAATSAGNSASQPAVTQLSPQQISQISQGIADNLERQHHSHTYKVGRNELCRCGSGLKHKKCCGDPAKRTASQGTHHPAEDEG